MARVLEIKELRFEDDLLVVEALVEDAVLVRNQTHDDPAEWAPAVCRGSLYICDEDLIPATDAQLCDMMSDRIDDWAPVDQSDMWGDD